MIKLLDISIGYVFEVNPQCYISKYSNMVAPGLKSSFTLTPNRNCNPRQKSWNIP